MAEFIRFSMLSIGGAFVATLMIAALAKPLSSVINDLIYHRKKDATRFYTYGNS